MHQCITYKIIFSLDLFRPLLCDDSDDESVSNVSENHENCVITLHMSFEALQPIHGVGTTKRITLGVRKIPKADTILL